MKLGYATRGPTTGHNCPAAEGSRVSWYHSSDQGCENEIVVHGHKTHKEVLREHKSHKEQGLDTI